MSSFRTETAPVLWQLPDGIEEILPKEARILELKRRELLDVCSLWGYKQVVLPLIEYFDALLVAGGSDLEHQTITTPDQISGKLMGFRADMTSQAARMDAISLRNQQTISRLCYVDTVVRSSLKNNATSRIPIFFGAELFGSLDQSADFEVTSLLIECLLLSYPAHQFVLEFGHAGLLRDILDSLGLSDADKQLLSALLRQKSIPDIAVFAKSRSMTKRQESLLVSLPLLIGTPDVLSEVARELRGILSETGESALNELESFIDLLSTHYPHISTRIDLTELHGHHYHTGILFSVYVQGFEKVLARGGRYDGIGESFGISRPATGFDIDLKLLLNTVSDSQPTSSDLVWAPHFSTVSQQDRPSYLDKVKRLRESKMPVIFALPEQMEPDADATHILQCIGNDWVIKKI